MAASALGKIKSLMDELKAEMEKIEFDNAANSYRPLSPHELQAIRCKREMEASVERAWQRRAEMTPAQREAEDKEAARWLKAFEDEKLRKKEAAKQYYLKSKEKKLQEKFRLRKKLAEIDS